MDNTSPTATLSSWIDDAFRPVSRPLGQLFGATAGAVVSPFSSPDFSDLVRQQFTRAGEAMPRFTAEAALYGSRRIPLKLAGLADVALRSSQQPGADTGSTIGQTAAFALSPVTGGAGAKMAGMLAPAAEKMVSSQGAKYLAGEAVRRVGGTLGAFAPFEAAGALEAYRRGEPYKPLAPENVVGNVAAALPFELMHVPGVVRGYKQAVNGMQEPLVTQREVADQPENWRVHWQAGDVARQQDFTDKNTAFQFSDELRKAAGVQPFVEPAGTMPRAYVQHEMVFKPEQLQAGTFGLRASEVLNEMSDKPVPAQQMIGTLKNKVPKSEWDALPGLEEFVKGQKSVAPNQVQQWLDQNSPKVEVRKVGLGGKDLLYEEYGNLTHGWFDTLSASKRQAVLDFMAGVEGVDSDWLKKQGFSDNDVTKANRYRELQHLGTTQGNEARWQQVSPKPESEMRDYVEGSVVVPTRESRGSVREPLEEIERRRGVLFPASHSFPPNTLGWFRGYMDQDASGAKVFHIVEVQSDWAQRVRELKEKEREEQGFLDRGTGETANRYSLSLQGLDHPLLPHWERLVLKAAIDHAIKNGADKIAVSDAETAMMTEGHDLAARERTTQDPMGDPETLVVPQEPGMRLHYDKTLPRTLAELTGQKGEKVELGTHKMVYPNGRPQEGIIRSDLVFKEPTGEPKTSITAQSFGLSRVKSELAKRGGFPMFGGGQFVKDHAQQMLSEGYDPDQIVRAVDNVKMLQPLPGELPLQTLARSVGIDPKLFGTVPPGQALPKAFEFLTSMLHYNYGYEPNKAASLARQIMTPLARFAPWLGQTQFAMSPGEEGVSRHIGLKHPGTETFQHLITLLDLPKSPVAARQTPDSQLFDLARSLGHEAAHNVLDEALNPIGTTEPGQRRAAIRALANVEAIPPGERAGVMQSLLRLVVPAKRWPEVSKINMDTYADSPTEFLADFSALISVGAVDRKTLRNMQDALTFGDRASQQFAGVVYRDLTTIWSGVRDWLKTFWGNKLGTREGKQIARLVDGVYKNMTKLMATRQEAERTLDGFQALMDRVKNGPLDPVPVVRASQLQAMFSKLDDISDAEWLKKKPVAYKTDSMKLVDDALAWTRPYEAPRVAGERLSFWKDQFKPMSQLVESLRDKVPSAVPVKALGFDYRGMVSEFQKRTWNLWQDEKGGLDWARLRWLSKDGTPSERAFSELALVENVRTQREQADSMLSREEREKVSTAYKALSDVDKDKIDKSLEQAAGMTRFLAFHQWQAHRDRISWEMAKVVMSYNKTLFHDQAKNLADAAVHWVFDMPPDPEEMAPFLVQKDQFFANLPLPDVGKQVLEAKIRENYRPWQRLGDSLMGKADPLTGERPGKTFYMPEVRVHDWHVAFRILDEDVPHHESYKTEKAAAERRAQLEGKEGVEWVKTFNKKDRTERFRGAVQEEISSAQQDALDALKASVLSGISSDHPEAQDIIKRINEEFQPATAFANVTVSPYMREREFIPGREDLNMAEGLTRYVDAVSYQMAKRHVKQAGQVVLFNPDMRANPQIRNEFEKYLRFITDAEGKEFNTLKNMVFFHYIGFNPGTMISEMSQQFLTLVPYMVENGAGVGETYKNIIRANKDLAGAWTKGENFHLPDPLEDKALQQAVLKRTVDTGFTSELYGETDLDFARSQSAFLGSDRLTDAKDLLARPLYQMLSAARKAYSLFTAANGRAAFLVSFRHEMARSGDFDKAVRFATQATDATMYGGGKAARPIFLQRFGSMSGVGGLMYSLGSYTLNTMAMMARLTRKAILAGGLPTDQKNTAMKAAGVMWATQAAFAGALGLPVVAGLMAVLEQVFPSLNAREFMRDAAVHLAKLATDDEDIGHMVADGALRGVMNLSGVDFGSRFQLANFLGISPYDGFSWQNVFGPAASQLANYVKGVGQASTGHLADASRTVAPVAIKQVLQLVHDDYALRDKAGRMISEMTPSEKVLATLGFKPQRLANYYEEQQIRQRTEDNTNRELRDVRTDAAKLLVAGDVAGARQRILKGLQDVGPYDPTDMAREATELAVEMQNPVERRSGARAAQPAEAGIRELYPRNVGIGEVQRVLQQRAMMQQLGLQMGRPSLGELRTASLVDSIMKQNPRLRLAQARLQAEMMTSPTARRKSSLVNLLAQ